LKEVQSGGDFQVVVSSVSSGSAADVAGVEVGDIIMQWDGAVVDSKRSLVAMIQSSEIGSLVMLTLERPDHMGTISQCFIPVLVKGTAEPLRRANHSRSPAVQQMVEASTTSVRLTPEERLAQLRGYVGQ